MDYATYIKKQEKEALILRIVRWAQIKKKKVENLTQEDIREAIKCKL
jgi:hypothetical protein